MIPLKYPPMLQAGIVGLPNVGKSTLFNALTRSRKADAANYPFCTIEPNVGVVQIPDRRLQRLAEIANVENSIPSAIEIVDIAGLVAGSSKGEGLGNRFLAQIREVDAIVEIVRCFDDANIAHTMGAVDPVRDIETISAELVLADLQSVEHQIARNSKKARGGDQEAADNLSLLERLQPHLNAAKSAHTLPLNEEESAVMQRLFLLSAKPVLFSCNVAETDLSSPEGNSYVNEVSSYVKERHNAGICLICARLEEDLAEFSDAEAAEFLKELGAENSCVSELIRSTFDLLGLASFFTFNDAQVRAWAFNTSMRAPQCAGLVHTDFEENFIRAEIVSFEDLDSANTVAIARERGKYRIEGKDYIVNDGDVILFRFRQS